MAAPARSAPPRSLLSRFEAADDLMSGPSREGSKRRRRSRPR